MKPWGDNIGAEQTTLHNGGGRADFREEIAEGLVRE